ncbi:CDP-diacylglycerol--serine O-phosphatidyltransferase [Paenibacillus alkalitolerans]|uniref:CDP-diacylglycerol--serine O-phosphatidyltransferase n=1 Tax=Paenibacillus alkalitolerans TaxID=2799335 RepID=UPI0018F43E9B|nr:CDP-diacylglycerol--serine O-phosphatidyltransferase [Paenibacillus alkalitolerans]
MTLKSLPNWFTVGNLFLGIIAIIMVFNDRPDAASMTVIAAMLLDGLDGRVARALNAQSEFGKELDSLSDVISFGVAPAFIMYVAAFQDLNPALGWIVTAVFPICGALRLARFNVSDGLPGYFLGLPIPAAGGVMCTLALFSEHIPAFVLVITSLGLSALMVSSVKYPNFKQFKMSRRAVWITPIVIIAAASVAVLHPGALSKLLFIPLLLYALFGLRKNAETIARIAGRSVRVRAPRLPKGGIKLALRRRGKAKDAGEHPQGAEAAGDADRPEPKPGAGSE